MKDGIMLELFSGSCQMSNTFKKDGWKTISIDYNPDYKPDIVMNVYDLTPDKIKEICFGRFPDVIWLSPDCSTYSKLGTQFHREKITRIPIPKSEYAEYCDRNNRKLFKMITELSIKENIIYFIENPRAYMRLMDFTDKLPRYTITYCQYGEKVRKETDIWTNHPNPDFKPPCKNGDKCHLPVGHNGKYGNGIQNNGNSFERAKIPIKLCEHIVKICNEYFDGEQFENRNKNRSDQTHWNILYHLYYFHVVIMNIIAIELNPIEYYLFKRKYGSNTGFFLNDEYIHIVLEMKGWYNAKKD